MLGITFANERFWQLLIPSMLIISGIVLKNGGKQYQKSLGKKENLSMTSLGLTLFLAGWAGVAYAVTQDGTTKTGLHLWLPLVGIAAIVIGVSGVMFKKKFMSTFNLGEGKMKFFGLLFLGGWILLGYSVAHGKKVEALVFGLLASVLVLGSMFKSALPFQRKHNIVDGPGMAMFALGWVSLAIANSM
jgi:hypothetical protein